MMLLAVSPPRDGKKGEGEVAVAANSLSMAKPASKGGGAASSRRRTFGEVTRDLLIDRGFVTAIGNPDWPRFTQALDGIQYETLRKAVTRDRPPSIKLMEVVSAALEVDPSIFWEYQLALAQRSFDPKEVGEDEAYANLQKWLRK